MIVISGTSLFGPFKTVETLADRLKCDNTELPFSVIGAYTISDDDSLIPPPPPVMPTLEEYETAVQNLLDTTARERLYDGILSLCTYANSTNAKFKAEALAGVQWRDDCWSECWTIMGQVQGGQIPQPTVAELVAMMPLFTWPV